MSFEHEVPPPLAHNDRIYPETWLIHSVFNVLIFQAFTMHLHFHLVELQGVLRNFYSALNLG